LKICKINKSPTRTNSFNFIYFIFPSDSIQLNQANSTQLNLEKKEKKSRKGKKIFKGWT